MDNPMANLQSDMKLALTHSSFSRWHPTDKFTIWMTMFFLLKCWKQSPINCADWWMCRSGNWAGALEGNRWLYCQLCKSAEITAEALTCLRFKSLASRKFYKWYHSTKISPLNLHFPCENSDGYRKGRRQKCLKSFIDKNQPVKIGWRWFMHSLGFFPGKKGGGLNTRGKPSFITAQNKVRDKNVPYLV